MKGFLEEVAADLYARYGEGLSERAVLFPSRRARLFFVDALGRIAGRPMWHSNCSQTSCEAASNAGAAKVVL